MPKLESKRFVRYLKSVVAKHEMGVTNDRRKVIDFGAKRAMTTTTFKVTQGDCTHGDLQTDTHVFRSTIC